ncbi:sugar ABC transporter substrate-binding protein [Amedibacillus sp. YH-ame6]
MKKIWILCCLLFLCGCGMEKEENNDFTYILFATPLKEHTIWLKAKKGFDEACEIYNAKCDWIGPSVIDTQEMENVIGTGILQEADAIVTQGVISTELMEQAHNNNIPVFLVDSDIPDANRFAYMGKDFHKQAELLLNEVEKKFAKNEPLKIAIQVAEKSFNIAQQQIEEVEKVFALHPGGYEIINISESKSDQVRAKSEWERVLQKNPEINVAINFAAESAESCADMAQAKGRKEKMMIFGVDDMESTLAMIRNNKIDGTIATSFYDYGFQSVQMLMKYLREGTEPSQKTLSPTLTMVTKDNIDDYDK